MRLNCLLFHPSSALLLAACAVFATVPAQADTMAWTNWSSGTSGSPGSASGTIAGGVTVTYSGQTDGLLNNYPSWTPTTSYTGGAVGNAPPASFNSVKLQGGVTYTETINFSSAIVNPVMAIWSLGAPGNTASFDFNSAEPFTVVAGGPSAEYGGSSIVQSGNDVSGAEGNGTIQFTGTFTSLTFTTPGFEYYYAFTVGEDATLTNGGTPSTVPEPATFSLLGLGLAALPCVRRSLARFRS